ncbi:MAG: serine/threonine-protein phosphatase [Prevotella sp.]|nr:serine/threonine-protein phosphatase [Prevotella sp.]
MITVLPVEKNLPIAAMPDWEFVAQETVLAPDTTLFLYTDGLDEAENAEHQMFGKQRIQATLHDAPMDPHGLIEYITQAVADYVGNNEQSDDLTMLAVRYK